MKKKIFLALVLMTFGAWRNQVFAFEGDKAGNGGDLCEDRIKVIRDDLVKWIADGGAKGLTLPAPLSLKDYEDKMNNSMRAAQVSCTSSTVTLGIDGPEKTCKNFLDNKGQAQILCNIQRFAGNSESDQYILIHHEYAGLAGFEVNDRDGSQYPLSNQISGYLVDQVVKKLAIHPPAPIISSRLPLYPQLKALFQHSKTPYDISQIAVQSPSDKSHFAGCAWASAKQTIAAGPMLVVNYQVTIKADEGPLSPGQTNVYPVLTTPGWISYYLKHGAQLRNGVMNIDQLDFGPSDCPDGTSMLDLGRSAKSGLSSDTYSYETTLKCRNGDIEAKNNVKRVGSLLIEQQLDGKQEVYTYCW